jgi:heat shock protein HslJ
MNNRRLISLLLAIVSTATASCSGNVSSPLAPSSATDSSSALTAGQLSGTWTLTSLQTSTGTVAPVPANAPYTLTFGDDRVSARADCNVCGGAFRTSGASVSIGPALACTRAACPTMEFETAYESMLAGESTATLDGTTLTLSSSRGRLTFSR